MRTPLAVLVLLASSFLVVADGEKEKGEPLLKLTPAEKKLIDLVGPFEERLKKAPAWRLEATITWKTKGGLKETSGKGWLVLTHQKPDRYRLEGRFDEDKVPQMVVVCDGKTITRLHRPAKLVCIEPVKKALDDFLDDGFTTQGLRLSGLDFLIRPDLRGTLLARSDLVEDRGEVKGADTPRHRFVLKLEDRRAMSLEIETGKDGVVRELNFRSEVKRADRPPFELTTKATLAWDLKPEVAAKVFTLTLPPGLRKVEDILSALQEQGQEELVGKPAPEAKLTTLSGEPFDLGTHKGKDVVVLAFWASWNADSVRVLGALDGLNPGGKKAEGLVAVHAVNVGETKGAVEGLLGKDKVKLELTQVLLDPKSEALTAYRVRDLPTFVVIGRDGKVHSFHRGLTPELRRELAVLRDRKKE